MSSDSDIPIDPSGSSGPGIPDVSLGGIFSKALVGVLVILLVATPVVGFMAWEPVQQGNVKVVKKWGAATGTVFEPGAHVVNPVSQSTVTLSTRPQTYTMSSTGSEGQKSGDDAITVLTEDGLRVDVDVSVRYRVDSAEAVKFYTSYRTLSLSEQRLIRPSIRSVLRTEAGRLPVTQIYTGSGQTKLKETARAALKNEFSNAGLVLEAVQIRNVRLPKQYAQAVEQKEITKQRRQQKKNELEVEKLEADRKRIEAEGQAEANRIISESLDRNVLTQKYIEKLDGTDTVYIPVGEGGYPQFVRNVGGDAGSGSGGGSSNGGSSNDGTTNGSASLGAPENAPA